MIKEEFPKKINQLGKTTLYVSFPPNIVEKMNLKKNDSVRIIVIKEEEKANV